MYWWQSFILGLCEHLAWPSVVIFCAIYYRQDIRRMLARIKTLPLGTELNSEEMKVQQEAKKNFEEKFSKTMEEQQVVSSKTNIKRELINNE